MGNQDKGLIQLNRRPMIHYALAALEPTVENIIINANRNQDAYARFGYPVVSDLSDSFDGPLAGILSALKTIDTEYLLSIPCDCPLIKPEVLKKMIRTIRSSQAEVCVATEGKRMHPVFLVLQASLAESLENYLASGQRKIDSWLFQKRLEKIDFSAHPETFQNINTPEELAILENQTQWKTNDR